MPHLAKAGKGMHLFRHARPDARRTDLDAPRGLLLACVLSLLVWILAVYIIERIASSS
ncbi:MAG TPA: hypothetical protein VMV45_09215 [Casimicrobiaceae bacterium]|nr:hypothetical protein [Casimicrobiaceae bacterium]